MGPGRLPTFLIVGAPRCATTSLAIWLGEHPDVFFASPKELHFFNRGENWARGLDWYRAQFANAGEALAVGEGTPNYMLPVPVIDRLARELPEVQMIACLREPVSRAYSNWHLHRALGIERRPFDVAIEQELAAQRDPLERPWRTWRDAPGIGMDYVARGQYLPQLERISRIWGRERLHVVLFDDIASDPRHEFAMVCRFLGVSADVEPRSLGTSYNSYREHHPSRRRFARTGSGEASSRATRGPGGYEPMPDALCERLARHFAPHNAALGEWLGRDLSAWDGAALGLAH